MFNRTHVRSFLFQINLITATVPNKSVYAIAAPYRESLLAKDDRWVDGGSARPGSRRGPPAGVMVFASPPRRQRLKRKVVECLILLAAPGYIL